MSCKQRLEEYLRENAVLYHSQHHARAITAQEVAATEHVPGRMFAKTVMVTTKGQRRRSCWCWRLPTTRSPPA
jgi:Ala-tRNA(Pro) deacylase